MQRLASIRFHDHCGTELEPGFEVFGDRIRLDDMDHVFFERPCLQRVGGRFRA
jgi:hypothetical protein